MGNTSSRRGKKKVAKKVLDKLCNNTYFSGQEIQSLYSHFEGISASNEDDGVIDKSEFKASLGLRSDSIFADRVFALFDENSDGTIDFQEFVTILNIFSPKATFDEKIAFSFKIYDLDGNGSISKDELLKMLESSMLENNLTLSAEQMEILVDQTFAEADADGDGSIDLPEYETMVRKYPSMMKNMTVTSISKLGQEP